MTERTSDMTTATATNAYEGVLVLGQDESLLLSVGNAEKLRNELNECLATAAGYQIKEVPADEVEPRTKIVIGLQSYLIKNVLMERDENFVIQWETDYNEECEIRVPADFLVSVMEVIE